MAKGFMERTRELLPYPGVVIRSFLLSMRLAPSRAFHLPVVAAWRTRIRLGKKARLHLRGRAILGLVFTQVGEVGQVRDDPTLLQLAESASATIGARAKLGPGVRVIVGPKGSFEIGDASFISSNSLVICKSSVKIGARCAFSWDIQIMDTDFHHVVGSAGNTAPVEIGDGVWVGSRVTILKGVKIGDGAIVAAGSVVTRNVPSKALVAGNPAKVIRESVDWRM